jgi:uncharacterized cupin superfamily protein
MKETKPITAQSVSPQSGSSYPEPLKSRMGNADWRALGDAFGLSQFGINLETLQPAAESALRHWHTLEDEFIYVLDGELTLHTDDGEFTMTAGSCVGFKAGDRNAHHLVNRGTTAAHFIVVGSRIPGDTAFYPDDDLAWFKTADGKIPAHKDGRPYPRD